MNGGRCGNLDALRSGLFGARLVVARVALARIGGQCAQFHGGMVVVVVMKPGMTAR